MLQPLFLDDEAKMEKLRRAVSLFYLSAGFVSVVAAVGLLLVSRSYFDNIDLDNILVASAIYYLVAGAGFLLISACLKRLSLVYLFFATHVYLILILLLHSYSIRYVPQFLTYSVFVLSIPMLYLEHRYITEARRDRADE